LIERPLLGVHLIRHPYDIIASAYRYHLVCKEDWCISPGYSEPEIFAMPEYRELFSGGRSYQEVLNSLPQSEGLVMEIWRSRPNILYMVEWDYSDPRFLECKLEDFTRDFDETFRKVLSHLRLFGSKDAEILEIAAAHDVSRWSVSKLKDEPHVTNKSRKLDSRDIFDAEHFQLIGELFPKDLLDVLSS